MTTTENLIIKIIGDVKSFLNSSEQTNKSLNRMTEGVQNFGIKFGLMMNGLNQAIAPIRGLTDAFGEQEVAEAKLIAAMKNVKTASADAVEQLKNQASALQKLTTFGDEQIINAQAMLGTFQLNEQQIKAITPRLLDMAAASQAAGKAESDLQSVAIALGKAFTGQPGMLSRYGVVLDKTAIEVEGFAGIVKSLDDNFKGMAKTVADTSTGSMTQFKNIVSDVKEEFGETISEVITPGIKTLSNMLDIFNSAPPIVKRVVTSLGLLGIAFAVFVKVLNVTMSQAGLLTAALAALAAGIWAVNKMLETYGKMQEAIMNEERMEVYARGMRNYNTTLRKTKEEMKKMEDAGRTNEEMYKVHQNTIESLKEKIRDLKGEVINYTETGIAGQAEALRESLIPAIKGAKEEIVDYNAVIDNATIKAAKIRDRIRDVSSSLSPELVANIGKAEKQFSITGSEILKMINQVGNFIDSTFSKAASVMVDKMNGVKVRWTDIFGEILDAFTRMITQMIAKQAALAVFNWATGGLFSGLGSLFGLEEGGVIHKAQKGLMVRRPTMLYAGEGGESEAVIPLSKMLQVFRAVIPPIQIMTSDPGIAVDYFENWPRPEQDRFVRRVVIPAIERELKR